jgi:hypothetical protein
MKPHEIVEMCASVLEQQDIDPSFKNRLASHLRSLKQRIPERDPALASVVGEYKLAVAMNNVAVRERDLERAKVTMLEMNQEELISALSRVSLISAHNGSPSHVLLRECGTISHKALERVRRTKQ